MDLSEVALLVAGGRDPLVDVEYFFVRVEELARVVLFDEVALVGH